VIAFIHIAGEERCAAGIGARNEDGRHIGDIRGEARSR
jgi:hypothetical protein